MKGRIKTYNDDKNFGFILGSDNENYFFHISNVKSIKSIKRGLNVTFDVIRTNKGLSAINIFLTSTSINPNNFICFNSTRIRCKNIKKYEVITWIQEYEYTYTEEEYQKIKNSEGMLVKSFRAALNTLSVVTTLVNNDNLVLFETAKSEKRDKFRSKLRINTYQNEQYDFFDYEIDIDKKVLELDNIFNKVN